MARRLAEGKEIYVDNRASYFYGVARNVLKEHCESAHSLSASIENLAGSLRLLSGNDQRQDSKQKTAGPETRHPHKRYANSRVTRPGKLEECVERQLKRGWMKHLPKFPFTPRGKTDHVMKQGSTHDEKRMIQDLLGQMEVWRPGKFETKRLRRDPAACAF